LHLLLWKFRCENGLFSCFLYRRGKVFGDIHKLHNDIFPSVEQNITNPYILTMVYPFDSLPLKCYVICEDTHFSLNFFFTWFGFVMFERNDFKVILDVFVIKSPPTKVVWVQISK
jgi:hypothetical protein